MEDSIYPVRPAERLNAFLESLNESPEKIISKARRLASPCTNYTKQSKLGHMLEHKEYGQSYLYGTSSIYRYLTKKESGLVGFNMPHNVTFNNTYSDQEDLRGQVPIVSYSPFNERRFSQGNRRRAIISSPNPVSLLEKIFTCDINKRIIPQKKDSLLYFLAHSTTYFKVEYSFETLKAQVFELKKKYAEVDVCIYFLDVAKTPKQVLELFDNCYCCGHMLDPSFLIRLHRLLKSYNSISYNCFGSQCFYASSLGLEVIHSASPFTKWKTLSQEPGISTSTSLVPTNSDVTDYVIHMLDRFDGQDISSILNLLLYPPEDTNSVASRLEAAVHSRRESFLAHCLNKVTSQAIPNLQNRVFNIKQ